MRVLVIGSINVDFSTVTKRLPSPGETVTGTDFYTSPGGKGANQAVSAARLGANVSMIGCVGKDSHGERMVNVLSREGVNTNGVCFKETPTGNAQITIQEDGLNTIVVYPGANYDLTIDDIEKNIGIVKAAEIIIMQLEIPLEVIEYVLELARDFSIPIILNPAPARPLDDSIFKKIDYLTPNETELSYLTGERDIKAGSEKLIDLGVKKVVVTLGSKGSYYLDSVGNEYMVPSYSVEAIDSTAAGDSFNAALAVGMGFYHDIKKVLKFANKVGALTTTKKGAISSLPRLKDLEVM